MLRFWACQSSHLRGLETLGTAYITVLGIAGLKEVTSMSSSSGLYCYSMYHSSFFCGLSLPNLYPRELFLSKESYFNYGDRLISIYLNVALSCLCIWYYSKFYLILTLNSCFVLLWDYICFLMNRAKGNERLVIFLLLDSLAPCNNPNVNRRPGITSMARTTARGLGGSNLRFGYQSNCDCPSFLPSSYMCDCGWKRDLCQGICNISNDDLGDNIEVWSGWAFCGLLTARVVTSRNQLFQASLTWKGDATGPLISPVLLSVLIQGEREVVKFPVLDIELLKQCRKELRST